MLAATNKVSIQIPQAAAQALAPLYTTASVAQWAVANTPDGAFMLNLSQPSKYTLARNLWLQLGLAIAGSLWIGFYIGRHTAFARKP